MAGDPGRQIGFILQDALVSLDQLRRVGDEIAEPLKVHGWGTRASRQRKAIELLELVGVPEPEVKARQRPYELSGGLRQRALIASAIALDPKLIVADEPTTALDVTIQAQVLDLLAESKARGTSIILISHDLSVVARLADEVVVMRAGQWSSTVWCTRSCTSQARLHPGAARRDSLRAHPRHPARAARQGRERAAAHPQADRPRPSRA